MIHLAFFTVIVMTVDRAPSFTFPVIAIWLLMWGLSRSSDKPTDGDMGKLLGRWALIILVGVIALMIAFGGGAVMEGRL